MNIDLLFVYGTLLQNDNEFGRYLKKNATLLTEGTFTGRLFDCCEYPGALADNAGYPIKGNVYRLAAPQTNLVVLDDYEGFGEKQEQPNLFIRQLTSVKTGNYEIECWVYVYNLPVDGLKEIASGDYNLYINS